MITIINPPNDKLTCTCGVTESGSSTSSASEILPTPIPGWRVFKSTSTSKRTHVAADGVSNCTDPNCDTSAIWTILGSSFWATPVGAPAPVIAADALDALAAKVVAAGR